MSVKVDVQYACGDAEAPGPDSFQRWVEAALSDRAGSYELSIRVVGEAEGAELNRSYRHRNGPTNVLSFPFEPPPGVDSGLLGDLVMCAPVVAREAREQAKVERAHWAHLTVHGVLHLLGYEHEREEDARVMETEEVRVLAGLGIADPYLEVSAS